MRLPGESVGRDQSRPTDLSTARRLKSQPISATRPARARGAPGRGGVNPLPPPVGGDVERGVEGGGRGEWTYWVCRPRGAYPPSCLSSPGGWYRLRFPRHELFDPLRGRQREAVRPDENLRVMAQVA